ncbi:hypothetical protein [Pseudomonas sp. CGJS7]|uniref:hypothetical protein n=1 Tax=Pseudomonas sp. CGJS7 TaxID=3109348 RepID=UPI00300A428F
MLDIDYAVCFSEANCRLFTRLKKVFVLINLLAGSAAMTTLLSKNATIAAIAGIVVAMISMIDLVYDPGAAAAAHMRDKQAFLSLRSRYSRLSLEGGDSELAKIKMSATHGLQSLARPAHNENLRHHGRKEYLVELSRWEQLVKLFA